METLKIYISEEKVMKRALSLIIALALTLALVPATFAAEESKAVDASNFFVFTNEAHGLTADASFNSMKHTLDNHVEGVGDPWAFVNLKTGNGFSTTPTGFSWQMNVGSKLPVYAPGESTTGTQCAIAFELDMDTAGRLVPSITYMSAKSSPKVDVYLVKVPDDEAVYDKWMADPKEDGKTYKLNDGIFYEKMVSGMSSEDYLGSFDAYGDGTSETAYFPAREVEATNYFLVLVPNGANEKLERLQIPSGDDIQQRVSLVVNSFAMSPRPELTAAENTLNYNFSIKTLNQAMLPNVGNYGGNTHTWTGLRSNNNKNLHPGTVLHDYSLADWEKEYNLTPILIVNEETGKADPVWQKVTIGTSTYNMSVNEECEPYKTQLSNMTDPYKIEGNVVPASRSSQINSNGITASFKTADYSSTSRPRLTVRINIPHAGRYELKLKHIITNETNLKNGVFSQIYFGKAPELTVTSALHSTYIPSFRFLGWFDGTKTYSDYAALENGIVEVPVAGEYLVVLYTDEESLVKNPNKADATGTLPYQNFYLSDIQLTPVADTAYEAVQAEYDAIANANGALVTYESEKGVAKTTTSVNALAAYIDGTELETDIIDIKSASVGGKTTVTAPEREGYSFLYWAKAASTRKMIMSTDAEYTFLPSTDATNLIAVYEKDKDGAPSAKAEFYNANGDLVATLTENGVAPDYPSLAGFEPATHWALYGSDKEYKPGDEIELSGTMIFVANYDSKLKLNITVDGGEVTNSNPEYGEAVTVTALERSGEDVFNYWEKDGKAVSFDRSYTFKAWEDTELRAVYNAYKPSLAREFFRIIIKNFDIGDDSAVMAEFIGLEDAIEKGVMFGDTNRSAMTTDDTQYSIIDDVDGEPCGYAIFSDGTIVYDK